jgi:integrase
MPSSSEITPVRKTSILMSCRIPITTQVQSATIASAMVRSQRIGSTAIGRPPMVRAYTFESPVPRSLTEALSAHLAARQVPGDYMLWNEWGRQLGPWIVQRAARNAREALAERDAEAIAEGRKADVVGLPDDFRYHDLRHFYASLLIASGANVKVVQARLRHASAKTTLDTYAHLWPDTDEATRTAVDAVLVARAD